MMLIKEKKIRCVLQNLWEMSKSLTQTSRDDHSHIIISTDYSTEVLHCDQDYYQIILDTEEKEVSEVLKYWYLCSFWL